MKTLHFDCFAGIAGDMALGALVDLGVDPDVLRGELRKLGIGGWDLRFVRTERNGITGIHAVVDIAGRTDHHAQDDEDGPAHPHDHEHQHDEHQHDEHDHNHHDKYEHGHNHEGAHQHQYGHSHEHHHNSWRDIRRLIENSGITGAAKKRALDIFGRIAAAEAQVHGTPEDAVAFHEVGALDSIIDIVGTAICLDLLGPDRITASEIELGGGTVKCAHGILPVPAPATILICRGLPVRVGGFNKEMTTPTGAAILAASVDAFVSTGSFRELKTGYGMGTRKLDKPNMLRVSLREESPAGAAPLDAAELPVITEDLVLMEANIDDMSGEALGFLMENLFSAGALDVTFSPCTMKKSRPGTVVTVLCPPARLEDLRRTMFQKSATLGFRETPVRRLSLRREERRLGGDFGEVRAKTVFWGDTPLRRKIEFEDRAALARARDLSLAEAEELLARGLPAEGQ
jgi:uncharacterized protein (TIGR00299 family) protein